MKKKEKSGGEPAPDKRKTALNEYKSLFPYLFRFRRRYVLGLVCLVAVDAAQIVIPQFIRKAIDLVSSGSFEWREVVFLCLWMTAIMALISLGRFFWRFFIHGSSRRIETEMREKLFDHLQTLSWDFYQKNKIGDLMARSTNDLNAVRMAIGMGLVAFIDSVVMSAAIMVIIFVQDAKSALFAVLPLPVITALILFFGRAVGKKFARAQETYSKMSDAVQETFAGVRVIQSFVKEGWFTKKFADANDDYRRANMELTRLFGFFFPLVTFLSELTLLVMLAAGGIRVIGGQMSPGSLVAMFRYLSMLIWPLMGAGFTVNLIQRGAVSLGRVNEILNTVPSIRDSENPRLPPQSAEANLSLPVIEVSALSFSYRDAAGEKPSAQKDRLPAEEGRAALVDVSVTVHRGQWLGIMGRTGSGKSTLAKTFTRLVDPPPGTVRVFGIDVRDWPLEKLRSLFAVSPQDSYLFSDSIKNNAAYGLDPPDPALTEKALALSALERDLAAFSGGGETVIGERGMTLSGGQKQRAAIARAIAPDSEFLILDDSLSAVDAETERVILEGLLRERKGGGAGLRAPRTTIIISHRISTLRYADKILVLDGGRTLEYGSPQELAAAGGYFSRMAALQSLDAHSPGAVNAGG